MRLSDSVYKKISQYRLLNTFFERLSPGYSPTHHPLISQSEFIKLQQLANDRTWSPRAIREVAHRMSGDVRSIYLGTGMDYEESRPYQSGDDLRFMNWRLSARTGQHYMKVFREEKRPATFILVDKRASMRFASRSRLKISQALRLSAYIAFSAIRRHCGVAGVVLNESSEWFDVCHDDASIYHFLNMAAEPCLPGYEAGTEEPELDNTIKLLQKMMVAGSDVCLISDFHDLSEASRATLLQLSLECNVTAIQVYDQAELELPAAGKLLMHSSAESKGITVDTANNALRRQYQDDMLSQQKKLTQLFHSLGINLIRVRTDSEQIDMDMLDG